MGAVADRLAAAGLVIPPVVTPLAAYVPAVRSGSWIFTAGQVPIVNGEVVMTGRLGAELSIEQGYDLARICGLNALAAIASVEPDLDRIARVVKVVGFVASTPEFGDQPAVVNGASELFALAFGDNGVHARSAVGVAALPKLCPVEVEVIVEVHD